MTRFCAGVCVCVCLCAFKCLSLRMCERARERSLTLSFAQFELAKTLFLIRVTRFERIHVTSQRVRIMKSAIHLACVFVGEWRVYECAPVIDLPISSSDLSTLIHIHVYRKM